ncbi:RNA polymerase, sigma subunit, ECF family [Actinacidiphila yanglinensis]|uniref:RNA polymerase, sigma subunit, ECF family n=1 Tax=Actinacidiphila yanglinensis TaxID=310779 RepID=A0A1H6CJ73_9ACTN|nr:RNA polymerase sigma factor [Actinacidiphila yanglinensis]SEG72765.1 RNA polymerase, sigma subunit, ECF family [Actinacidiphila yanglinensis]
MIGPTVEQAITRAHHKEWARVVAFLARRFGDLDIAEEATAEAFAAAAERWPRHGVPPNPGGWLATTATRKAIDWLRRESQRDARHQAARIVYDDTPPEPTGPVEDDRLRLVFTCCHPALAMEARVALTLRLLGGLSVPEIARAFLLQETTMARRITRAKAKIKAAHIPYRVPSADDLRERLAGVLAVVYLVFNEGYLAGEGDDPVRVDLTDEAIHLGRLLRTLLPDDGEVAGLLALMLFTDARRPARVSRTGELVTLGEQDRGVWDRTLIAEGNALVRERIEAVAAGGGPPGRYQLQAAINAVHTAAPSARDTNWSAIVALYDHMALIDPSPIVWLNRAVAVAEVDGCGVGLTEIDRLGDVLGGYHAFHAARADLLRRLGRGDESRAAYDRAIGLAGNPAERAYLTRRRDQLAD